MDRFARLCNVLVLLLVLNWEVLSRVSDDTGVTGLESSRPKSLPDGGFETIVNIHKQELYTIKGKEICDITIHMFCKPKMFYILL